MTRSVTDRGGRADPSVWPGRTTDDAVYRLAIGRRLGAALLAIVVLTTATCGASDPGQPDVAQSVSIPPSSASDIVAPADARDENAGPPWLLTWLGRLEAGDEKDPPAHITRYEEADGTVYFVEFGCCDRFSDLYDADGQLLGHPDGGITGAGDGSTTFSPTVPGDVLWSGDE